MFDLKIIESFNGILSAQTWPRPDYVESTYLLISEIVKCLFSSPGEDKFDPTYGSGLRPQIIGLTGKDTDQVKQIVGSCLQKVKSDLTSGIPSDDPSEVLTDLQLMDLIFNPNDTSWLIRVNVITPVGFQPITVGV